MGEGTVLWESRRPTGPERLDSSLDYLKRMSHLHPVCNAGGVTMCLDQASGVQVYLSLACGSLTLVSLCQGLECWIWVMLFKAVSPWTSYILPPLRVFLHTCNAYTSHGDMGE